MSQRSGFYPRVRVDGAGRGVVSNAGGTLLTDTIRATGLDRPQGLFKVGQGACCRHDRAVGV